jgi:hypothetical protein
MISIRAVVLKHVAQRRRAFRLKSAAHPTMKFLPHRFLSDTVQKPPPPPSFWNKKDDPSDDKNNAKPSSPPKGEYNILYLLGKILDASKSKPPSTNSTTINKPFPKRRRNSPFSRYTNNDYNSTSESDVDILNVFKVPDMPKARRPDAYPLESWESYTAMLREVASDGKIRKRNSIKPFADDVASSVMEYLEKDYAVVEFNCPTYEKALRGEELQHSMRKEIKSEIKLQRERFCEATGFTYEQHGEMVKIALMLVTNLCASRGQGSPLPVLWGKMKEAGICNSKSLCILLYVASTFVINNSYTKMGSLNDSPVLLQILSTSKNNDDSINNSNDDSMVSNTTLDILDEIATLHDLLYSPSEQTALIRVRLLVAQNNASAAEAVLQSIGKASHLRIYTPVIRLYLQQGKNAEALSLFTRVQKMPSIALDAETYIMVIAGLLENGCFESSANPIQGALELGYSVASGPALFDDLLSEMSKRIYEIPMGQVNRFYYALSKAFPDASLQPADSLNPVPFSVDSAKDDDLIASRVRVDPDTGKCLHSNVHLRLIKLSDEDMEQFKQNLITVARQQNEEVATKFSDGRQRINKDPKEELSQFLKFLDERQGKPYTAFLDGANIGFNSQNFENGRFSFHQIQLVVDALEQRGETPLVICPTKYMHNTIYRIHFDSVQKMTSEEINIRSELIRKRQMYVVPPGFSDDHFWMIASASKQIVASAGECFDVEPNDPDGRWPGKRPMIISNDRMRDHKLVLMTPMLFRRWYSNSIVVRNLS